ncbi:MAG TPA: hypothetical protein VG982_02395 [Candidatus Paceibacterota bacterium]|jgi:hypothetical protein|nr:hypothetical protein [Candidatus Paceibacterota bacterium]
MNHRWIVLPLLLCLGLLVAVIAMLAYLIQERFQIKIPTIKTNTGAIRRLAETLPFVGSDVVIDLGSGNGSTLFAFETTARVHAIGYELSIVPFLISTIRKNLNGYSATIRRESFLSADLSEATYIYTYLYPHMMERLVPIMERLLADGTRTLISCDFPLPGRTPQKKLSIKPHTFYLYGKSEGN